MKQRNGTASNEKKCTADNNLHTSNRRHLVFEEEADKNISVQHRTNKNNNRSFTRNIYNRSRINVLFLAGFLICMICFVLAYRCLSTAILYASGDSNKYIAESDFVVSISSDAHRPHFIIHPGPHKTGTTTIQCDLEGYMEDLVRYDLLVYSGKYQCHRKKARRQASNAQIQFPYYMPGNLVCLRNSFKKKCDSVPSWNKFMDVLASIHDKGLNVLHSDEGLSRIDSKGLIQLDQALKSWDVSVVIAYRWYFEWIASFYNEIYEAAGQWPELKQWPGKGGIAIPTFGDFLDNVLRGDCSSLDSDRRNFIDTVHMIAGNSAFHHPSYVLREKFKKHFSNVSLFDIHMEGDLTANFLCRVLNVEHTCAAQNAYVKMDQAVSRNLSVDLHYDILVVAAFEAGILVNQNLKRKDVVAKAKDRQENLGLKAKDFPLKCLSSSQKDKLLALSIKYERDLFLERFSIDQDAKTHGDRLKIGFDKSLAKNKFCSIDAMKVLEDKEWKFFFQSL